MERSAAKIVLPSISSYESQWKNPNNQARIRKDISLRYFSKKLNLLLSPSGKPNRNSIKNYSQLRNYKRKRKPIRIFPLCKNSPTRNYEQHINSNPSGE